jgi:hypothetical protein
MGRRASAAVLGVLGAYAALLAILSLRWRMAHDSAIMLYVAFLGERYGRVPYRDLFDINAPGVHAVNRLAGALFGYGHLGFRIADLLVLAGILAATWGIARRLGGRAGIAAPLIFAAAYLSAGPHVAFQRDYVLILPVALSVLVATGLPGARRSLPAAARAFAASLLYGIAATIKPHAALGYPLVAAHLLAGRAAGAPFEEGGGAAARRGRLLAALAAAAGFLLPAAAAAAWLTWNGALPAFLEMARAYWPFYPTMNGDHGVLEGSDRLVYLAAGITRFGYLTLWFLPAALGVSACLFQSAPSRPRRRLVVLLSGLAAFHAIYPALSGKFWSYHYHPFLYFLSLLAATVFMEPGPAVPKRQRTFAASALVLTLACQTLPARDVWEGLPGGAGADPMAGRVEEIAGFLEARLRPGEKVQPLDWTGGSVQGMLEAGAELATSFYDDFHFYHHVAHPYIQALRARFLSEFDAATPRFVVEVVTEKPWVWGAGTTREFPDLRRRLDAAYRPAFEGDGYVIHERR